MSTARHVLFREPTHDDWSTFAAEFWDHWDEGEPRGHWADRAAKLFLGRFPQTQTTKRAAEAYFTDYWNARLGESADSVGLSKQQQYALFFREYERWWGAFAAEIEDEGLDADEIVYRFTRHFHTVLAKRLGVSVNDTSAQKEAIRILVDCNKRFDLGFESMVE